VSDAGTSSPSEGQSLQTQARTITPALTACFNNRCIMSRLSLRHSLELLLDNSAPSKTQIFLPSLYLNHGPKTAEALQQEPRISWDYNDSNADAARVADNTGAKSVMWHQGVSSARSVTLLPRSGDVIKSHQCSLSARARE